MRPFAPAILVGILALMAVLGLKAYRSSGSFPSTEKVSEQHMPGNIEAVSVSWQSNTVFFPVPLEKDGSYWVLSYRNGEEENQKRVSGRRNGQLYATFPQGTDEVWCWVSGGHHPTYARSYDRP